MNAMQPRRSLPLAAALTLTLTLGSPAFAQDPTPTPTEAPTLDPITTRVELSADSLPQETRAEVELELAAQLSAMASEVGFTLAESEAAGLILRVELGQPDHKNALYVINAAALHEGQLLERAEARTCFRCTPAELVADALELLPRAVAQAIASRPRVVAEPVPAPALTDAPKTDQVAPRAPRPGPAAYVGISIGALGLVGAIAGGVLLTREPKVVSSGALVIRYEPPGVALLSVGLTSILAGAILMAIDAWVLGPRRAAKLSQLGVAPDGLTLAGRF